MQWSVARVQGRCHRIDLPCVVEGTAVMVEDGMLGEADATTSDGALCSVVAPALEWAENGRLERLTFARIDAVAAD